MSSSTAPATSAVEATDEQHARPSRSLIIGVRLDRAELATIEQAQRADPTARHMSRASYMRSLMLAKLEPSK